MRLASLARGMRTVPDVWRGARTVAFERWAPSAAAVRPVSSLVRIGDVMHRLHTLAGPVGASAFVRGSAWIVGGNGTGHLVLLAASPWLARLYSPEQFGSFGAFMAVLTMIVAVAGLRYEIAVPVPVSDATAARLAVLALVTVAATAVVSAVAATLLDWVPAAGIRPPGGYGTWLGLGIAGIGGYQVLSAWSARTRAYRDLSLSRIVRSATQVAVQLGLGGVGFGSGGLIVGHVTGGFAGVTRMARSLAAGTASVSFDPRSLLAVASAYRRYPLYSAPSGLLNAAGNQVPLLIVLAAFGPEVAGLFAFAQRIIAAPVTVIGLAVGQVFVGEFGALVRSRSPAALRMYLQTAGRLFLLGAGPIGLLALVAPGLFGVVFGPAWTDAGMLVRILCPMLLAQFAVVPVSSVLNLLERTGTQLVYDVVRLLLGLGAMMGLVVLGRGASTVVAGYALGMLLAYVFNVLLGYGILRRELANGPRTTG